MKEAGRAGDLVEEYVGEAVTTEEFELRLPRIREM